MEPVVVVGIAADGTLAEPDLVAAADVVLGAPRQLALLPDVDGQDRVPWPHPLRDGVTDLVASLAGRRIVALASGDPLVAGIGSTLVDVLGSDAVEIHPSVSSISLARARLRWPAEDVVVLRDPATLPRHLADGRRVLLLSTDGDTPRVVSAQITELGFGATRLTVLARLGAADESVGPWDGGRVDNLHVLALEVVGHRGLGLAPGLPDDAFEHDGQLTKRDLRASALSRLAPAAGELLWDVGAGAGSVAIEWLRTDASLRAVAIEKDADRAARIARNAARLGVPSLDVVVGGAPEALDALPTPDAVFVGGGASRAGVLEAAWSALRPGGRLVAHAVTLETEAVLASWYAEHGGELTRIAVETAAPVGTFTGWTPARAITQWVGVRP